MSKVDGSQITNGSPRFFEGASFKIHHEFGDWKAARQGNTLEIVPNRSKIHSSRVSENLPYQTKLRSPSSTVACGTSTNFSTTCVWILAMGELFRAIFGKSLLSHRKFGKETAEAKFFKTECSCRFSPFQSRISWVACRDLWWIRNGIKHLRMPTRLLDL